MIEFGVIGLLIAIGIKINMPALYFVISGILGLIWLFGVACNIYEQGKKKGSDSTNNEHK